MRGTGPGWGGEPGARAAGSPAQDQHGEAESAWDSAFIRRGRRREVNEPSHLGWKRVSVSGVVSG